MKARIFIGSSTEGLPIAQRIKAYFEHDYECVLWNDDLFRNNESFLETLLKSASLFDYGFLVFSADDVSTVRDKNFDTPRDNILFEFGLFLGRMGVDRAFIIAQEETKIPTDILGITLTKYNVIKDSQENNIPSDSLEKGLEKLKKQIDNNVELCHLGLLPSTALAISYFEGFVKLTAQWIEENTPDLEINGKKYEKGILKIKLPETLDTDINRSASMYYKKQKLEQTTINTKHRNYPIYFVSKEGDNTLEIYDMPTILNGLDKAIDLYFRVGHIGKTTEQKLTEENEMNNFKRVLQHLINEDAYCRECVSILE